MESEIQAAAEKAIHQQVFPGCVIGVLGASGGRRLQAFGRQRYEPDSPEVSGDTLYDCASITKSIPTATLALQLVDEGKLSLDERLIEYIPEYRTIHREEVLIRHLLTYTLGNTTPLASLADKTPDKIFQAVCTEETYPSGTIFSYSNTPAFLLGIVIERILGMQLESAASERIFRPLRMSSTTFTPHGAAPTEEGIVDIVHDESARIFARSHRAVGHSGLFSNVPDLLNFLENLLVTRDERLTTNQIAQLNASTALGWELDQPFTGKGSSPRFGKTGFTGTSIVCDGKCAVVILSNHTYPHRRKDASVINSFRSDIADIVLQDV